MFYNLIADATDIPMFHPCKIHAIRDRILDEIITSFAKAEKPASSRPPTQSFRLSIIYRFARHSELHTDHERGFQSGRQAQTTSIILVNHECHLQEWTYYFENYYLIVELSLNQHNRYNLK